MYLVSARDPLCGTGPVGSEVPVASGSPRMLSPIDDTADTVDPRGDIDRTLAFSG
ncbi:MAG TPA: hypothetical protein VK886_17030 [Vicinamibacterales bacterium]|nr:hypothetical protein [Vicinamibacterales bacterium]